MRKLDIDISPAIGKLEILSDVIVNTRLFGRYKSTFKGRGLEFDSYRTYMPTDDASLIDWKASKRTKNLLVKQFVEERNLNVFFLVDVSDSMLFGSVDKLKNEYTAELVISLSYAVLQAKDNVGFALFSDTIKEKSLPDSSPYRFYSITQKLINPAVYGGAFNLVGALEFMMTYLSPGSLIILVSDFIGMSGDIERTLKMLAKKFDVIAVMIRDPRDSKLPQKGKYVIKDVSSERQLVIDSKKIWKEYEHYASIQESSIRSLFLEAGFDFLKLDTNKSFINPILEFFTVRNKRWR